MKHLYSLLFLSILFSSVSAQQVGYRLLNDNPDVVPTNYYYLYYFDYQGALLADVDERNNAADALGASVDVWQELSPSLGITGNFKYTYGGAAAEVASFPVKIDAGVFYRLGEKKKVKDVKVNVSTFKTKVDVE